MKIQVLPEPGLQFANGGTHIDIRAGLAKHGTFDRGASNVPVPIGVGLIGAAATLDPVREWIESCRTGVAPKLGEKLPELRPAFPGMRDEIFGTSLAISDVTTRSISRLELQAALDAANPMDRIVDLFMDHARDLAGRGHLNVLVIAPPAEVFGLGDAPRVPPDAELDEAQDAVPPKHVPNFHDSFKARALDLAAPCQVLRPDTYGGGSTRGGRRRATLQDPATRAWNFHTALYYKAGGVPWRLVKHSAARPTCYVGASFFKSIDGDRLATSVAQVFNERGEGLILQGGNATIDRRDLTPHLSAEDAHKLLANGLAAYRREHGNMPARVLVHKTSSFNAAEIEGCRQAAQSERVEVLDLVSVRRAGTRLLRAAVPSVVRGTALTFDDRSGIVYLKGTVPYFRTYPGMYIPRALEFTLDDGETAPIELAKELLDLSKLNFNNTQFDSGDPITVRAARRVGDILKHVPGDRTVQSRFRFFT
ncbi:MAG TPA: hypothetical protein VHO06_15655 [Polyangia bacterium]|nr:hypothetical protein [Polyangia bacterium]